VVMKFSLLSRSFLLVRVAKSSVLATSLLLNGLRSLMLEENILWDVPRKLARCHKLAPSLVVEGLILVEGFDLGQLLLSALKLELSRCSLRRKGW
jgi:hypothetical protein